MSHIPIQRSSVSFASERTNNKLNMEENKFPVKRKSQFRHFRLLRGVYQFITYLFHLIALAIVAREMKKEPSHPHMAANEKNGEEEPFHVIFEGGVPALKRNASSLEEIRKAERGFNYAFHKKCAQQIGALIVDAQQIQLFLEKSEIKEKLNEELTSFYESEFLVETGSDKPEGLMKSLKEEKEELSSFLPKQGEKGIKEYQEISEEEINQHMQHVFKHIEAFIKKAKNINLESLDEAEKREYRQTLTGFVKKVNANIQGKKKLWNDQYLIDLYQKREKTRQALSSVKANDAINHAPASPDQVA